jgi:hypothetical protein
MSEKGLSPLEMLDTVLAWFAMEPDEFKDLKNETRENLLEPQIWIGLITYYPDLENNKYLFSNITLILKQLGKDGKLDVKDNRVDAYDTYAPYYSINFNGKFFSKEGGYVKQRETSVATEKIKNNRERLLVRGTWAAAAGGFLLAFIEIYKLSKEYHWFSFCH